MIAQIVEGSGQKGDRIFSIDEVYQNDGIYSSENLPYYLISTDGEVFFTVKSVGAFCNCVKEFWTGLSFRRLVNGRVVVEFSST